MGLNVWKFWLIPFRLAHCLTYALVFQGTRLYLRLNCFNVSASGFTKCSEVRTRLLPVEALLSLLGS